MFKNRMGNAELKSDEKILFEYLVNKQKELGVTDGMFTVLTNEIEKSIGFKYYKQKTVRAKLEKHGLLATEFRDVPRKLYYGINAEAARTLGY